MPRYFFHSMDGTVDLDDEGSLHDNDNAARVQAIVFTGEILRESPEHLDNGAELRIEVMDVAGKLLFTVVTQSIVAP